MKRNAEFRQAGAFGRKAADRRADTETALDAEFITLPAEPASERLQTEREPASPADTRRASGMALFDTSDALPETPKPDDKIAFYGFSAVLALLAFWVSGGHVMSERLQPRQAMAVPTVALEQVSWRVEDGVSGQSLLVDGVLRNDGTRMAAMSPVMVTVRRTDGRLTRFSINPGAGGLAPGEMLGVNARLDLSATASVRGAAGVLDTQAAAIETVTVTLSK